MENVGSANAPRVSVARTTNENVPRVVEMPVMPPEPTHCMNNVRPGGICPETTLNRTGFSDVRQPVVEKDHVFNVPT